MLKRAFPFIVLLVFVYCQGALADSARETPVVRIVRERTSAVVNIGTERTITLNRHPFWRSYGQQLGASKMPETYEPLMVGTMKIHSLGSGILVSGDGLIATNAHVVGMASRIFITLSNGEHKEAKLIGTDNANDIALVKIDTSEPLPYLLPATDVMIGETVVSIGNPFGFENSASSGIVSGTGRILLTQPQIPAFSDLIQTDAPINQGSSGGALVNLDGQLIGMNLAVVQNAQGLGFAIPARKITHMLEEYGKAKAAGKAV